MQQPQPKLILPNLICGIGNQLFIASAAYAMSKFHPDSQVLLCKEFDNEHNTLKHDYRDTILRYFGTKVDKSITEFRGIPEFWHPDFQPWNPLALPTPIILKGYYQHLNLIEKYEEELSSLILKGLEQYISQLQEACKESLDFNKTAFIHIRRGDYLNKPEFHYIQPIEYYEKAYEYIVQESNNKENPIKNILLFSDDTEWVSQQSFFKNLEGAIIVNEPNELASLALMTLCKGGAVIANSTFSWWGAFLGAHKNNNPICVPAKWINSKIDRLFPAKWKIINY